MYAKKDGGRHPFSFFIGNTTLKEGIFSTRKNEMSFKQKIKTNKKL